jgi:hypothetical protein
MVRAGLVTAEQLHEALLEQQQSGLPLGRILISRGYASSAAVANALADQSGGVLRTEYGVAAGTLPSTDTPLRAGAPPGSAGPTVAEAPRSDGGQAAAPPVSPRPAPASEQGRRRVRVEAPERRSQFADYCHRLGAEVHDLGDGWFEVGFAGGGDELEPYLASWSATNEVVLEVARRAVAATPDEPVQVEVAPASSPVPRVQPPQLRVVGPAEPAQPAPPPEGAPSMPQTTFPRGMRLGELLVHKGLISQHQLAMALLESQTTGMLLGRVLLEKQWLFEDELARCLSEQWNLRFVSLGQLGVDRSAVRLVPKKVGLQFAAIPVRFTNDNLDVAFVDPTDEGALEAIDFFIRPFNPVVATLSDITRMWRQVAA